MEPHACARVGALRVRGAGAERHEHGDRPARARGGGQGAEAVRIGEGLGKCSAGVIDIVLSVFMREGGHQ